MNIFHNRIISLYKAASRFYILKYHISGRTRYIHRNTTDFRNLQSNFAVQYYYYYLKHHSLHTNDKGSWIYWCYRRWDKHRYIYDRWCFCKWKETGILLFYVSYNGFEYLWFCILNLETNFTSSLMNNCFRLNFSLVTFKVQS